MCLKLKQRLNNSFFTKSEPRLFTSGAKLVPMVLELGNFNFRNTD